MRDSVENLVIGGGLAGSTLALRLAAAGREVVLLEKEREAHDKVCGEFLSREAVHYLRQAGIDPLDFGACSIQHVYLHSGNRSVNAALPFAALSLSRRVLDETLLTKAQAAGCDVRRGALVDKLELTDSRWRVRIREGTTIDARTLFLATGKHDVNAWGRDGATQDDLAGFKMHLNLPTAQSETLHGAMELFLFCGGYGGLSLVEAGLANLCLVVRRKTLRAHHGWDGLFASIQNEMPAFRNRLHGATPCSPKPLAISPIPYGHLGGPADGIWRLGDQVAVIPSFTGDGMSIALHSAVLAAEMYLDGHSADDYTRCLVEQLRGGMRVATTLSRAMLTSGARIAAPFLLSMIPSAIGRIALSTRIPERALLTSRANVGAPFNQQPASIG